MIQRHHRVKAQRGIRRRTTVITSALLVTLGMAGYETGTAQAQPDVITILRTAPGQPAYQFQGFGVSLAWWANVIGGWSPAQRGQIEDALFSTADANNPNRLGLNVIRYNIGASAASGNPPVPDLSAMPSGCKPWAPGAAVPVVQPGPDQPVNLGLDTLQIRVLTEAIDRVNNDGDKPVLEAFANSAPWWMTISQCPQGLGTSAILGGSNLDNLQIGNYVHFLTNVLRAFRDQLGISFDSVEPLNEPSDPWFIGEHGQEGMTVDRTQLIAPRGQQDLVIEELCSAIHDAQLGTTVAAPDGFNPDGFNVNSPGGPPVSPPDSAIGDFTTYAAPTQSCISKINTHMYNFDTANNSVTPYMGTGRQALAGLAAHPGLGQSPKHLWMSEFGTGDTSNATNAFALQTDISSGISVANQITRDIHYLRPAAWVYWQAVEATGGWGLLEAPGGTTAPIPYPFEPSLAPDFPNQIDPGPITGGTVTPTFVTPTKRFFALEQYSRFIRPGDFIIASTDPTVDNSSAEQASTVSAVDPNAQTLTIVTTNNTSSPRTVTYDFSSVAPNVGSANVDVYRTDVSNNVQPDPQPLQAMNGQFTDTQAPFSINTYVVGVPGLPGTGLLPNQPPVVNAGPDVTGSETQPIALQGSATDPDSDPLRIQWSASPATGTTDPHASCIFADPTNPQTTVTCSDEGDYALKLTADDGFNLPVSSQTTVHVTNLGPSLSLTSPAPWQAFGSPATVSLTAPITDPGANDTQTCVINWDDGTPPETFAQERSCDRTHTYTAPGIYTITVKVTDDDQHSDTKSVIVVVFDPNAGRVTGGGWINSSPGAYAPDPTIGGKLHFTFQASYPAASATPAGNVSFRLQDIGLKLDAASLDWLVVSPDGEAAIAGIGTMGSQQVRFILYGYQGCGGSPGGCQPGPDAFRAVIWPASQGSTPTAPFIYDNVPGADLELADATPQPLDGGNIQIHP